MARTPELFIGLTGAIGTNLDNVASKFEARLQRMGYDTETLILSRLLESVDGLVGDYDKTDEYQRVTTLMDSGDAFRKRIGMGGALVKLALPYVRKSRNNAQGLGKSVKGRAYIFKSLKHTDEVKDMRMIYGMNFWLVSVYSPRDIRLEYITNKMKQWSQESHCVRTKTDVPRRTRCVKSHGSKCSQYVPPSRCVSQRGYSNRRIHKQVCRALV